jgi:hypothetical protein
MLFHHSNGSCYVVDCGSAHGTFVNGQRIAPPLPTVGCHSEQVRRGALIPSVARSPDIYMKSFSFRLKDIDATTESPDEEAGRVTASMPWARLHEAVQANLTDGFFSIDVCRKRSFDSVDSNVTLDEPSMKRLRCSSPPLSRKNRCVSSLPILPSMTAKRRVFSADPPQLFSQPW